MLTLLCVLMIDICSSDMEISETVGRILEMCTVNTASIIQGLTTGAIINLYTPRFV